MRLVASAALACAVPLLASATPGRGNACPHAPEARLWIPAGQTIIGDNSGYPEEGPAYRTKVNGFEIDATEVTNAQFEAFVRATGHVTTAERRGDSIVFVPPAANEPVASPDQWWRIVEGADWRHPEGPGSGIAKRANYPVVHVSHADALAFARWAGRRLPSEEEFERAAQGGAGPSSAQPGPDNANTWQGHFPQANLKSDGHAGLAPVGCYEPNGYGAYDLIGNVWEWTASWYLPGHGPAPVAVGPGAPLSYDPAQPGVPVRVIKGGSFLCAANYCARYRPSARHAQAQDMTASHLGFRTASSL